MEDFARDGATRTACLALVERGELNGHELADGFAALAGELGGWSEEKRRLQAA